MICVHAGEDFGTGTIIDHFHPCGNVPARSEILRSLHTEGAINSAVILSILAEIPSGPDAFEVSKEDNQP